MPKGEHPAEGAQDRTATPAVRRTTAFDGAHALDEPTDDREEQVQTQRTTNQALHEANVWRPNGSGQWLSLALLERRVDSHLAVPSEGEATRRPHKSMPYLVEVVRADLSKEAPTP
jgi:hypothetical protein